MGLIAILKKLSVIDAECKKNDVLRKQLEPLVINMNKVKPTNKAEARKMAQKLIDEYERIKQQINNDIRSEHGLDARTFKDD